MWFLLETDQADLSNIQYRQMQRFEMDAVRVSVNQSVAAIEGS